MSMRIRRVALYVRVSTEEQAIHGFSIQTQKDNLAEYCKKNKLKIVDFYVDEGISGAKPPLKRPALKRLLEDVEAGKIDMILFTKLDRWFRSVKEYFKVQDVLDNHKVEWKAIQEDYDTTTANGKMAITIFLAVAQNERDRTAERIKVVFEHKVKNKEACFGGPHTPLGYKKEPDENGVMKLVKDPETQDAVQEFWNIIVKTHNLNKAIRHMRNVYGIERNWKTWSRMTQSTFYCGMYKGIEDYCPSYVSPEEFLKFQETKPEKQPGPGRTYIFRGLMRCPVCGHKMCGNADTRYGRVNKSYRCTIRSRGCSNQVQMPEIKLEKYLLKNLKTFVEEEIAIAEIELEKPKPKPKVDIKGLKEKLRRLNVIYMAGNLPDEEYHVQEAELKLLISKAEEALPPKPRDLEPLREVLEDDFESLYETFDEEEKQLFWRKLVKEIELDGRDVKRVIFN